MSNGARVNSVMCRLWMAGLTAMSTALLSFPAQAQQIVRNFDVPPQSLSGALLEFGRQAQISIVVTSDLTQGRTSKPLKGSMTTSQGLARILEGSGLGSTFISADAVRVTRDRPESGSSSGASTGTDGGSVGGTDPEPDPSPAGAKSQGFGDIVVTAQRRSEKLQNVPIAITALSGEAITAKGISNTLDLGLAVPGLTFNQLAGLAAPRIRGIGTVNVGVGNENSVAMYVDGVYYASAESSILSLNNIAQVAVLKGPQGTLFGRNATGGLIQITTLDPKQDFGGKVSASYGNHDSFGGSAYVTGGLAPRLSADLYVDYSDQRDGFGRNIVTGSDVNNPRSLTIRSKWLLQLDDETTVKLSGDYARFRTDGPARRLSYDSTDIAGGRYTGGKYDIASDIDPLYLNRQGGGSLTVTHHFDGVDLVSITAYRKSSTPIRFDVDGLPFLIANIEETNKDRQFTQELQLNSTGSGPLTYAFGLYYFDGKSGYSPVTLTTAATTGSTTSFQRAKAPAAYGQASYRFDAKTSLTLGFRYSYEKRDLNGSSVTTVLANGLTIPEALSAQRSASRPTWRIALDRRLSSDAMVYASYNRGFKSGGFTVSTLTEPEYFKPERLDAYEVGTKVDLLGRRLRINAAAFYYDYKNIQLASFLGGLESITNAATARIYGLDMDVSARPVKSLTLSAGLSYLHDRFGSYPNGQTSVPLPTGGNLISSGDLSGNRLPYTPDWTLDLGLDYDIPIPSGGLRLSTQYFHSDGWRAEPDNRLRQPPYNLVNASVTWKIGDAQKVSVSAWGKNLSNQIYDATLQTQAFGDVVVAANGRTFGATLGYAF